MQIIDNVAETLKDLTITALKEMGDMQVIADITLEELPGTICIKLIVKMEPHQEGDIEVKHDLFSFLNEDGVVMISPEYKLSYEAKDKRDDDLVLTKESLLDLIVWGTYFSNEYQVIKRPTRYKE